MESYAYDLLYRNTFLDSAPIKLFFNLLNFLNINS
jgi:hypothetical protein